MMLFTGISLLSYAQERVHYNGRDLFLSGMNVAWVNFAADLGPGYVDTSQFRTIFKAIHTNGGNSMRLWLHTNGTNTPSFNSSGFVIGPGVNAIQDLKNILKIAHQNNIGLQLSLWSHDILNQSELDTAKLHRNAKLISDTAYTMAYIRNSLIPMVQSVIGDSAIIAWEVFNEPEGITNEYGWAGRDHVPIADVQKAINLITGAIHRTDSHALVTSGANNFQTLTDNNTLVKLSSEYFNSMDPAHQDFLTASFNNSHRTNFTTKQYIGYLSSMLAAPNQNYYRDDRLIAAGGDILGTLDYYNVHFYGTQQMSPFNNAYSKWGLTKPLVAGEFYMQDDFGVPWQNLYEQLYTTGYAGGLSWAWNDNYNNVQRTYTEFVMNKMFSNHRNDIIVNPQIGTIYKYYANTTTIQVTDSATLYWDVEPGSVVTLNGNSVSSYDSIIVSPSVTTSYVLSASGQTSSSLSITITVLPTGRIMSFKALPSSIGIGENSLLTWQVVKGSTVTLNGLPVKVIDGLKVTPDSLNNSFVLRSQGTIQDSIKITILILQPILVNRALNQPVNVSSNDSVTNPLSKPQNINDGDNSTVWQAVNANGQWVQIDLVKNISLDKIVINWGNQGYASQYKIQLSENLASWQTIFTTLSGTGGVNNVETLTNLQGTGRYLIFLLQTRASGAFTIKDIQVYGLPSDTDIKFTDNTVPSSYALFQNYPNPFNPVTKINFSIPLRGRVKLEIYDLLGQRISTLVNRELQPGNYTEMLDARNLSSGIYFYTLRSENVAITKKMILLK
jgi:hypothetical protein